MPEELKQTPKVTSEVQKVPDRTPKRIEVQDGAIKKKPFWKRVRDTFFVDDCKSIAEHVWKKILVPSIKKLIYDSANQALGQAVYGDNAPNANWQNANTRHVDNSSVYAGRSYASRNDAIYNRANRYNTILEGCLFAYKDVPIEIIREAMSWIADFGFISVETFNQMLPAQLAFDTAYTDRDWGWYSLNENCVVQVPGGWTIDLPPCKAAPRR